MLQAKSTIRRLLSQWQQQWPWRRRRRRKSVRHVKQPVQVAGAAAVAATQVPGPVTQQAHNLPLWGRRLLSAAAAWLTRRSHAVPGLSAALQPAAATAAAAASRRARRRLAEEQTADGRAANQQAQPPCRPGRLLFRLRTLELSLVPLR